MSIAATLMAVATIAGAQDTSGRFAVDGQVGTTGVTISLHHRFSNRFIVRTGIQYADLDVADEDYDGVQYDVSVDFNGAVATVDYHPFRNGFALSTGFFYGQDPGYSLQ
ncbi:MAG: hypothetical protein AAGA69_03915, partial [Pseudomonadota bacterium]